MAWNLWCRCYLQIRLQTENLAKITREDTRTNLATEVTLPIGFSSQHFQLCFFNPKMICSNRRTVMILKQLTQ